MLKKVKIRQSKVKFSKIGKKEDLVIHAVGDASYKCDAPSVGGNLIMLGNKNSNKVSPIFWKSKQIQKVCHSAKEAETRNIMTNVDTAVYLSAQLSLLLFGDNRSKIPVRIYTFWRYQSLFNIGSGEMNSSSCLCKASGRSWAATLKNEQSTMYLNRTKMS